MSYLRLQTPKENRSNIICFFLILLYLIGLIPIIGVPFSLSYFIAAIIPVGIIQLWALIYLIAPYKYEKSYYLFFGIYGVVNTYIYFLAIQKMMYINMGAQGSGSFIIGVFFFIALLVGMNLLNWKALYSGTYYKLQQKSTIPVSWMAIGGAGYILGQLILSFIYTDSAVFIVLIVCISLLSLLTAYFSIYIHRYYYMSKNMNLVRQVYPEFGMPMSERYRKKKKNKKTT
ncbi:hypothetical protein [Psychrobacillus sp. OK032]|uniref:hypothetical protein n=1 Tax=Psychrobacillus sp. OK032 TaxID=1884358 RepID=UPI0008C0F73F|nr:hypothetical protein [Psychrobacillus sp. OK032]SER67303.1 hypothetical protein SAMN05518872_101578 [Psychrobacillus sp. OK032]